MFVFSSVSFDCLYIYMWLSLLQAWVHQHFRGIGSKDACGGYRDDQHPRHAFCTMGGFVYTRLIQRASGCAESIWCCHDPIWRAPSDMSF
jgi:hypothetical protein